MSEQLTVKQVSRDLIKTARERAADPRKVWGIPYGLRDLDALTGGIHEEEMTILMARPGVGKTALMGQVALSIAEWLRTPEGERRHPNQVVKIVECEMSAHSFQERIVCLKAHVGARKMREGMLTKEDLERFEIAAMEIAELPIEYLDAPSSLENTLDWLKLGNKTAWWACDYIGIHPLSPRQDPGQYIRVSEISKGFREFCKHHAPGMVLSQMNRDCEKREDPRPKLSDLRDSGSLEQDGWNIFGLHRDDTLTTASDVNQDKIKPADLYVIKHRRGPLGRVRLNWVPNAGAFFDVEQVA
jgi:replicative DNA helicase